MAKGTFRIDFSFSYTDTGVRLQGGEAVPVVVRPRVDLLNKRLWPAFHDEYGGSLSTYSLDAAYGLSSRVTLIGSIPFFKSHSDDVAHFGLEQEFIGAGSGDSLLGVRYALGPPGLVAGLSVELPTGSYRVAGEYGGGLLDPRMQPGSGSFDFVTSLQYSHPASLPGLDFSAAASYQANTTNALAYRFGNLGILTVGANQSLLRRLTVSLQAKLVHEDRSVFLGAGVPSTGSTFVYAIPGLRASLTRGISVYTYVQLLPYRYVNESQLAPRIGVLSGVSKSF